MTHTYPTFQGTRRDHRSCSGRKQSRGRARPTRNKITSVCPCAYLPGGLQPDDELVVHVQQEILLSEHVSVLAQSRNFFLTQNLDCYFVSRLIILAQQYLPERPLSELCTLLVPAYYELIFRLAIPYCRFFAFFGHLLTCDASLSISILYPLSRKCVLKFYFLLVREVGVPLLLLVIRRGGYSFSQVTPRKTAYEHCFGYYTLGTFCLLLGRF